MVAQEDLTKPLRIATQVPAPDDNVRYTDKPASGGSGTIEIRACSELTEHAAPVNHFSTDGKLKCVQGFQGEPLVFAIGNNNRLNCLAHESGAAQGWTLHDISPPSKDRIVAFDVSVIADADSDKGLKAGVTLVAATQNDQHISQVFATFVPAESLVASPPPTGTGQAMSVWQDLSWTTIADPEGGKDVTSVLIGTVSNRGPGQSTSVIWAGTRQRPPKAATFYAIDLTPNATDPWVAFAPATSADEVKDMQPASLENEDGLFVFSSKRDRTEYVCYTVNPKTLERGESRGTMQGGVGRINSIYASRNPWNGTDVAVAGEQGVGLVDFRTPSSKPIMVGGLPAIGFRQAVCSEKVNPQNESETSIVMFAVSNDNALYYIQGTRQWSTDGSISLKASGLPIRQNVSHISCQYNQVSNTSDLVYTGTAGADAVKHLIRDPATTAWSETNIAFAAPLELRRYHAFVTTVALRDARGRAIPAGFPIEFKAEAMHVVANDAVYRLGNLTPSIIHTDSQGQVVLVAQASENAEPESRLSLKAPVYSIRIEKGDHSHETQIQGGQRVVEGLQKLDSPEKLASAKSTTGESIFAKGALSQNKTQFEQSAGLLKELPSLLGSVSGSSPQAGTGNEITLGKGNAAAAFAAAADRDSHEEHEFLDCIGDAIEWLRDAVKESFKVVFRAVAQGVKFLLTIGGKVLSFVVETAADLLSAVGDFLKETLGIDFKKFFKMIGLIFDPAKTKANQEILKKTLGTALRLPGQIIKSNAHSITEFFDIIELGLKPYLDDETPIESRTNPDDLVKDSPLAWILDNPIMKIMRRLNPISIIVEAASEEFADAGLGEDFQVPDIASYLSPVARTLCDAFKSIIGQFIDFFKGIASDLIACANDPSKAMTLIKKAMQKAFRFLFNTVKTLVTTAWTVIGEVMDAVVQFLEAKWKIPLVTTLFTWYAEQDFTLMNLVTFVAARLLGIIVGDDKVANLVDPGPEFDKLSEVASSGNIFSPCLQQMRLAMESQPQPPTITTARIVNVERTQLGDRMSSAIPAPALFTSFLAMNHGEALSPDSTKHDESSLLLKSPAATAVAHELSHTAKARIHTYERWSTIIATAVSLPRMFAVYLETTELMVEIGAAQGSDDHHDGPAMTIPIFAIVTTACSTVASVTHLCNWLLAREHSPEVKAHIDHNFEFICAGVSTSLAGNCAALGCSVASYIALKQPGGGGQEVGKKLAAASGFCMSVGGYGETIFVHMVPAFRSDESTAVEIALSFVELVGNTGGVAALVGGLIKDPDTVGVGVAIDGLCTFVSTLTGAVLLIAEPKEDH